LDGKEAEFPPYVAHPDTQSFLTRDDSRVRYQDVPSTRSVKATDYILHCTEVLLPYASRWGEPAWGRGVYWFITTEDGLFFSYLLSLRPFDPDFLWPV